jgi:mannose-6-phosphate isomerase
MTKPTLYPLLFDPIYQYRLWGGRRLASLLTKPLPDGPVGEAWILSDRAEHASQVSNGVLKGQTIHELMEQFPEELMGNLAARFSRFPLLLKFLDAKQMLSVQVHPSKGKDAKTEAWVVLEAGVTSRIYAGLKTGTTEDNLRSALSSGGVEGHLVGFQPKCGDAVFIPAGTVHSLGGGIVVFEVQQNSDVTFRLYDWKHVDAKTGQPRPLQVDEALASINYEQGEIGTVSPVIENETPLTVERLFKCQPFTVWRRRGASTFQVGAALTPRVLVCTDGGGRLEHDGVSYELHKGNVALLPAVVGSCDFNPLGSVSLLEIALPEPLPVMEKS